MSNSYEAKRPTSGKFTSGKFTSGKFTSGLFRSGLNSPMNCFGVPEEFMIGEKLDIEAAVPFRLAPRIYQVSCVEVACETDAGVAALDDLPLLLVFRESTPQYRDRQCWVTDNVGSWQWELIVEQRDEIVAGTLTATPPCAEVGAEQLIWRSGQGWDPFGSNLLHPESARQGDVALVVRVP